MPKAPTRVDLATVLDELREPDDPTRDRIVAAAATLLAEQGLSGIEVEEVAAAAGVGRSTLYRRVGDRNDLLAAAVALLARRFFGTLADAVVGVGSVDEQVAVAFHTGWAHARATGFVDLVRTEPELLRLVTVDGAPLVAAASGLLAAEACRRDPSVDVGGATVAAELLVRLAISFVVTPAAALDLDGPGALDVLRRHLGPLVASAKR